MRGLAIAVMVMVLLSTEDISAKCSGKLLGRFRPLQQFKERRESKMSSSNQSYSESMTVRSSIIVRGNVLMPSEPTPVSSGAPLLKGAKFSVGQKVKHAGNLAGLFPAGTGVIDSIVPWNTGDGFSYRVRCDMTKRVLPTNFKDSELMPY